MKAMKVSILLLVLVFQPLFQGFQNLFSTFQCLYYLFQTLIGMTKFPVLLDYLFLFLSIYFLLYKLLTILFDSLFRPTCQNPAICPCKNPNFDTEREYPPLKCHFIIKKHSEFQS